MRTDNLNEFRRVLTDYRINRGWSQLTVSNVTGGRLTQTSISRLENESRTQSPMLGTLAEWAEAYRMEFGLYLVVDGDFRTFTLTADETGPPPTPSVSDRLL